MEYKLDQIIKLMNECLFDEDEFKDFIEIQFPNRYGTNLNNRDTLARKITTLVRYINRDRDIPRLLNTLKFNYLKIYREYESKLIADDNEASQQELINIGKKPTNISSKQNPQPTSEEEIEKRCDILILSANVESERGLRDESKIIETEAKNFTVKTIEKPYLDDLFQYIADYQPLILHFSGHGNPKGEIIFNKKTNNQSQQTETLSMAELAKLLSKHKVECVVLNACFSGAKVDFLKDSVLCIIGMNKEIEDKSALKFSEGFYRGIGRGDSYASAFEEGTSQINLLRLPDSDVPHFIPRDASIIDLKPSRIRSENRREIVAESFIVTQKNLMATTRGKDTELATAGVSNFDQKAYPLWFGTNRQPVNPQDISEGFLPERDNQLHFGQCGVIIPKSHEIGSTGQNLWKNIFKKLKFSDDRLILKPDTIKILSENVFWSNVTETLKSLTEFDNSLQKNPLIFIHGYNVSFEGSAIRAAQLGCDLNIPPGLMGFYSWPSKATFRDYPADGATIEASEKYIYEFLKAWLENEEVEKVNIIAHSMGNRGLLRVMQRIFSQVQTQTNKPFGQIILAAPDVDPDLFKDLAQAYSKLAERTTLYVSSKDKALQSSGFLHDYPRVGYCTYDQNQEINYISIVDDIDTIEVSKIDLSLLGHGYFSDARDLLQDIHELLNNNKSPNNRFGLQSAFFNGKKYWSIRK